MRQDDNRKRQYELDLLRAMAMVGIIGIHVISSLCNTNTLKIPIYIPITALEILCRSCLLIFFLISGYLLLGKQINSIGEFYKKRFVRVIPLFLFATFMFTVLHNIHTPMQIIPVYLTGLINANIFSTFWFVYVICALYLITPFISKMIANLNEPEKKILLMLIVLMNLVNTFWDGYDGIRYVTNNIIFVNYAGLFLLGGLIKYIDFKKNSIFIYIMSVAAFVLTIILKRLDIVQNIYDNTIFMVLISTSIVIWIKNNGNQINKLINKHDFLKLLIVKASGLSYGIYLFHPILLSISLKVTSKINMPLMLNIIVNILVTFILSLIFMQILEYFKKLIKR